MKKKDLKVALFASALTSAAFIAPVMADETDTDPVEVQDQTTETTPVETQVNESQNSTGEQDQTTVDEEIPASDENESSNEIAQQTSKDGWQEDGRYLENGEYKTGWFTDTDGKTYYFNDFGYKYTSQVCYVNGTLYGFSNDGSILVGQQEIYGKIYYFNADGSAITNDWYNGYYYDWNGFLTENTVINIDGQWYAFMEDGHLYSSSGWQIINGNTYYLNGDGTVLTNTQIDGKYLGYDGSVVENGEAGDYYLVDGVIQKNQYINGRYYESDGKCSKGKWMEIEGHLMYFNEYDGHHYNGWIDNDGTLYFSVNYINDKWYGFDENGYMLTGWQKHYTEWYYFQSDGSALTNTWKDGYYLGYSGASVINGEAGDYYLVDGVIQKNQFINGRYYGSDGLCVKESWELIDGHWMYFNEYGYRYAGWSDGEGNTEYYRYEINGKYYTFDENGYMMTGWVKIWNQWYYFNSDGSNASNQQIGEYYVGQDGAMLTNTWATSDTYVGSDGKKISNDWEQVSNGWKYKLGDGTYAMNKMFKINGKYYAFGNDGLMIQNSMTYVYSYTALESYTGYVKADGNGYLTTGWYQDEYSNWYYMGDNYLSYETGIYDIGNKKYYFYNNIMQVSTVVIEDGKVYIVDANGYVSQEDTSKKNGWAKYNDSWYYFEHGKMVADAIKTINGKQYYFDNDGAMLIYSFTYDNQHYITDENGAIITQKSGWYLEPRQNDWYFFENGKLVTNQFITLGNNTYYFGDSGIMRTGVFNISSYDDNGIYSNKYYYADNNGVINYKKGWINYQFDWYYSNDNGELKNDEWYEENGKKYYFNYSSYMVYGVQEIRGDVYFFDSNGVLQDNLGAFTGWKQYHGEWYYSDGTGNPYTGKVGNYYVSNGKMQVNTSVDNFNYFVDYNGEIQKGWINTGSGLYDSWLYADSTTGKLVKNQWLKINGQWYYFSDQYMVTGYYRIDGQMNYFDKNGIWQGVIQSNSWVKVDDEIKGKVWCYVNDKGNFNFNDKLVINGQTYYFTGFGKGATGGIPYLASNCVWYDRATKQYHWINKEGTGFDDSDGWKKTDQGFYSYFENGTPALGYKTINGKVYFFNPYMETGIINYNGKAYVYDSNGNSVSYKEGWNSYEGQWYYIQNGKALNATVVDGYYLSGYLTPTGIIYSMNMRNGILVNNGKLATNQWVLYNGDWYYGDANGRVVTNQWVGNYYVDSNGRMVKNAWIGNYHVGSDGKWDASR